MPFSGADLRRSMGRPGTVNISSGPDPALRGIPRSRHRRPVFRIMMPKEQKNLVFRKAAVRLQPEWLRQGAVRLSAECC